MRWASEVQAARLLRSVRCTDFNRLRLVVAPQIPTKVDTPNAFTRMAHRPVSTLLFLILAGVQTELDQFGAHGDAGDAEPARGFGLVALGLLDGAGEKLAL